MKLLLFGATGLVGGEVFRLAIADPRISAVTAPVRRELPAQAGLVSPRVDFEQLPEDAHWWQADAVICALGTTLRAAGSRDAFRRVDHAYPLEVARIARRHGTPTYVLNSAMGADPASRFFYNRVKGDLERDLARIGFPSLTFVRPGLIGGERNEVRVGERAMAAVLRIAAPVLPPRLRINPATNIASAMLEAAVAAAAGTHVISSAELAVQRAV
ncbi:NAD-dependent dehydratase [Luteimonas sp. MC1825]|uniref:NAD-dependent dehydratase n=1 Tax=Luteimonas sp. MC1825 TaxID=2761107 RepID=UPI00161A16E6|nr:NAD-dependent dehydratase [Luteimonas sp. MC1825]MBB6599275.1 NAD-dependent dehydratase [Luteimonas sp. MC1825]QOC89388.1 NAD-dependent dehydratase [Luteimonas sp. MC1825]